MTAPTASPDPTVVAALRRAGCVFAEEEATLLLAAASTPAELADLLDRRIAGTPLEHLLGWADFCGQRIAVDPGVFVPRRRTELLVREAIAVARPGAVVVDLCCGTAAVAVALAAAVPGLELHAADVDPAAVRCARRNLTPIGGHVHSGDLFAALPSTLHGRVDVLTVNAPYVPSDAVALMPPEARLHEPRTALDGGTDGLDVQRRVVAGSATWLAPGGHLLVETGRSQAAASEALMMAAGLTARMVACDELEATVVVGRKDA